MFFREASLEQIIWRNQTEKWRLASPSGGSYWDKMRLWTFSESSGKSEIFKVVFSWLDHMTYMFSRNFWEQANKISANYSIFLAETRAAGVPFWMKIWNFLVNRFNCQDYDLLFDCFRWLRSVFESIRAKIIANWVVFDTKDYYFIAKHSIIHQ